MSQFDFENNDDPWASVGTIAINNDNNSKTNKIDNSKKQDTKVFNPNKTNDSKTKKSQETKKPFPVKNTNIENNYVNTFNDFNPESNTMADNQLSGFVNLDSTKKTFNPNKEYKPDEEEDELPLLEALGISTQRIKEKIISVFTMHKLDKQLLEDSDMAGPFMIFVIFAISLILQKKTHF